MGFFDQLKNMLSSEVRRTVTTGVNNAASQAANKAKAAANTKKETFTFSSLPKTLAEFQALPEAELKTPFQAGALTVVALCAYAEDREAGTAMLNFLRGPGGPMNPRDLSFINDRFMDGKKYIPYSYFAGATPDNDYTPSKPYTLTVATSAYSFENPGYVRVDLVSGGADSARNITLREKPSEGKWYLWEQFLLSGVRDPKSQNPWA